MLQNPIRTSETLASLLIYIRSGLKAGPLAD